MSFGDKQISRAAVDTVLRIVIVVFVASDFVTYLFRLRNKHSVVVHVAGV